MSDTAAGGVIVKHIDELEAALRYAHKQMQPMLEKAVATILGDKCQHRDKNGPGTGLKWGQLG